MPFFRTPSRSSPTAKRRGRSGGDLLILACGLVAFFVLAFLSGPGTPGGPGLTGVPAAAPTLVAPQSPSPDPPGAAPATPGKDAAGTAGQPAPALPPAAAPVRIVYPSAGFDVTVRPLVPSPDEIRSQTIVPPISVDGFWVATFGTPGDGSANTTYIMGHSWEDRDAPFNRLSSATAAGDVFDVVTATGKIRYRVESISTEDKSSLKENPIWQVVPNRVVLISCYTEDLFGKNVVIVASPAPAPKQGP